MKALTLTQPWATLIALGAKKTETRGWRTDYRGPLAIHAAKGYKPEDVTISRQRDFAGCLMAGDYQDFSQLPRGAIVATCILAYCLPTEQYQGADPLDCIFGNYSPGRFAFLLTHIKPLYPTIPARGALSLWNWEPQQSLEIVAIAT